MKVLRKMAAGQAKALVPSYSNASVSGSSSGRQFFGRKRLFRLG